MSELPPPVFRKTKSGTWAVMAPVETLEAALADDGKVEVHKKDGGRSKFTVVSLGKPFDIDGVEMCYGYSEMDEGAGAGGGAAPAQGASAAPTAPAPAVDPSEPLPEYQGEDVWDDQF